MASSILSIIVLIFLAALVAAFAISAGVVALLNSFEKVSLDNSVALEMALSDAFRASPESVSTVGANVTITATQSSISDGT